MIRLSASLSRKLPVEGIEFLSQSVSAGLEVEVSDSADGEEIAGKLRSMYSLLDRSIAEQIATGTDGAQPSAAAPKRPFLGHEGANGGSKAAHGNDGNNHRDGRASAPQVKTAWAIAKDRGLSREDLVKLLQAEFGVDRPDDLSIKDASDLITKLRQLQVVPASGNRLA
jgi:hypothetical protein